MFKYSGPNINEGKYTSADGCLAAFSMKGMRKSMEDRFIAFDIDLFDGSRVRYGGIFDGHGGQVHKIECCNMNVKIARH